MLVISWLHNNFEEQFLILRKTKRIVLNCKSFYSDLPQLLLLFLFYLLKQATLAKQVKLE